MTFDNLLLERDGSIAIITINRPKVLNALNAATMGELSRAFLGFKDDDSVRVVIITGAGEKAFIAGADITEFVRNHFLAIDHGIDRRIHFQRPDYCFGKEGHKS